jgi:hypothetical protein
VTHIIAVTSVAFRTQKLVPLVAGLWASLPFDFYIKSIGKADFQNNSAETLPIPTLGSLEKWLTVRALCLNCVTSHYSALWRDEFDVAFCDQAWSQPANTRLPHGFFAQLSGTWTRACALRSDYSRRMALIELDVLASRALGLSLEQLLQIYKVQFPVMQEYEMDTWYDMNGRIAFTTSKGLVGVGLSRKVTAQQGKTRISWREGATKEGLWGWDDVKAMWDRGDLPDGTRVEREVVDDSEPGGPVKRRRSWAAPFTLASREEDYRVAWAFFGSLGAKR